MAISTRSCRHGCSSRAERDNPMYGVNKTMLAAGLLAVCGLAAARPAVAPITVANEITTRNVRSEESTLADVIADAIRDAARSDAAFMLASSFTDVTIPKGNATAEDVLKALEYRDDSIIVVKLTGAQIRKALEHGLRVYPQKHAGFLQLSGLTVNVDPNAEPEKRVTAVRVGSSTLSDTRSYTVAMPSPLASGA